MAIDLSYLVKESKEEPSEETPQEVSPEKSPFDFSHLVTPERTEEENAVLKKWNELFPEASKVAPPIPKRKLREPEPSPVVTGVRSFIDEYILGVPGKIWSGAEHALTYSNAIVANSADAFMRAKADGADNKGAGEAAMEAFIESASQVPGVKAQEGVTQWSETLAGERVREQAYSFIHNPTRDPLLAQVPYTVPETLAAETVGGLFGLTLDIYTDPLTYAVLPSAPVRVARGLAKLPFMRALKNYEVVKALNAQRVKTLQKLYLDVGTNSEVVEAYRGFLDGTHSYTNYATERGKRLHGAFVAAVEDLGFPKDHAILYMLDAMDIRKLDDVSLLPRDLRAPVLRMHKELRAKGEDLFQKGYIEKLLASDELYLPRALETVSGRKPPPKVSKLPERSKFSSEEEYLEAAQKYREDRLKLKEYYATTQRKQYLSSFGDIVRSAFYTKPRKFRSATELSNHLAKIGEHYGKDAVRLNANFFESGIGSLISMNTRLMWHDLVMDVMQNPKVALKLRPMSELKSLPNGWIPVRYERFPKPVKETLAGQLRHSEVLGEVQQISENAFTGAREAFKLVNQGKDVWLMEPQTFKFMQRMRRMNMPEARGKLFTSYMATLNMWKRMATYMRLAFNVRNWTSGQEFAYLSGVNAEDMVRLTPEVWKVLSSPDSTVIGHSSWRLAKLFSDNGIFARGRIGSDIAFSRLKRVSEDMRRGQALSLLGIEPRMESGTWGTVKQGGRIIRAPFFATDRAARAGSMWIENACRGLTALNEIEKAEAKLGRKLSPKELNAIMPRIRDKVNEFHIDYAAITPELKALKPWLPFITFPVHNQRMLWERLVKSPERVARLAKFKREMFPDLDPGELSSLTESDYMRVEDYRHIPYVFEKDGVRHNAVIHYGIDLPSSNMRALWNLDGFSRWLTPAAIMRDIIVLKRNSFGRELGEIEGERVPAPFWATWLPEDTIPLLDLGMMISKKTGQEVLGMDPVMKSLIETALPFLSQASKAFPQEGTLFYEEQEKIPAAVGLTTGIKLRVMTDLDQLRTLRYKNAKAREVIQRLIPSRPRAKVDEILRLLEKNLEIKPMKQSR